MRTINLFEKFIDEFSKLFTLLEIDYIMRLKVVNVGTTLSFCTQDAREVLFIHEEVNALYEKAYNIEQEKYFQALKTEKLYVSYDGVGNFKILNSYQIPNIKISETELKVILIFTGEEVDLFYELLHLIDKFPFKYMQQNFKSLFTSSVIPQSRHKKLLTSFIDSFARSVFNFSANSEKNPSLSVANFIDILNTISSRYLYSSNTKFSHMEKLWDTFSDESFNIGYRFPPTINYTRSIKCSYDHRKQKRLVNSSKSKSSHSHPLLSGRKNHEQSFIGPYIILKCLYSSDNSKDSSGYVFLPVKHSSNNSSFDTIPGTNFYAVNMETIERLIDNSPYRYYLHKMLEELPKNALLDFINNINQDDKKTNTTTMNDKELKQLAKRQRNGLLKLARKLVKNSDHTVDYSHSKEHSVDCENISKVMVHWHYRYHLAEQLRKLPQYKLLEFIDEIYKSSNISTKVIQPELHNFTDKKNHTLKRSARSLKVHTLIQAENINNSVINIYSNNNSSINTHHTTTHTTNAGNIQLLSLHVLTLLAIIVMSYSIIKYVYKILTNSISRRNSIDGTHLNSCEVINHAEQRHSVSHL